MTSPLEHPGHGSIRGLLVDGATILATGYTGGSEPGCTFINEEGSAMLWTFDLSGNLLTEQVLDFEGMAQGAKVIAEKLQ